MFTPGDLLLQVTNAILLANLLVTASLSHDTKVVALSAGDVKVGNLRLTWGVAAIEAVASPFGRPGCEARVPGLTTAEAASGGEGGEGDQ